MNILSHLQKIYMSCVTLLILAPTLDASEEKSKIKFINPSMSFYLNETQIAENTQAALKGDADAAFKNYQYYNFLERKSQLPAHWLLVAALLEHPIAMHNWSSLDDRNLLTQKNFIVSPQELKHQEELFQSSGSMIECYWLYLHCVASGNQEKSAIYKKLLQKQKVSENLLGEAVIKRLQELDIAPK